MTDLELAERITRLLAFMLRHQPEQFDLALDAHGFAHVEDVLRALSERSGAPVLLEDLEGAVNGGDRQRYQIQEGRIRALYGHSIPIEPGASSKPPEFLFVGVPVRDLERARRYGLRGGRRRFLHLALDAADAIEAGKRAAQDYALLKIRALDAWEEGVSFYDRLSLWLAESIPTHFLEMVGEYSDGREPIRHGESDEPRRERPMRDERPARDDRPEGGAPAGEPRAFGASSQGPYGGERGGDDRGRRRRGRRGGRGRRQFSDGPDGPRPPVEGRSAGGESPRSYAEGPRDAAPVRPSEEGWGDAGGNREPEPAPPPAEASAPERAPYRERDRAGDRGGDRAPYRGGDRGRDRGRSRDGDRPHDRQGDRQGGFGGDRDRGFDRAPQAPPRDAPVVSDGGGGGGGVVRMTPQPAPSSSNFGLGVFEESTTPPPAPRAVPPPAAAPVAPAPRPEPERSSFGAGL